MTDCIDRKAALEECDWYANEFCECEYAIMPLKGALENLPAADVRPAVRGRWIKCVGENGVTSACRCSLCGFEDNRFSVFNYCPNCGAMMEGKMIPWIYADLDTIIDSYSAPPKEE